MDWVASGVRQLKSGGRMLLYTGSTIVNGADPFLAAVTSRLQDQTVQIACRELDRDIFGGLLSTQA